MKDIMIKIKFVSFELPVVHLVVIKYRRNLCLTLLRMYSWLTLEELRGGNTSKLTTLVRDNSNLVLCDLYIQHAPNMALCLSPPPDLATHSTMPSSVTLQLLNIILTRNTQFMKITIK